LTGDSARVLPSVNTSEPPFRSHYGRAYALVAEQKISEGKKMTKNIITSKKSGRSADIPTEVPEPDQVVSGKDMPVRGNTTCSGMRGNMILFLADRQDRLCKRLNKKIERLDRRLGTLEERERLL
jgi:hypothetical protein